MTITEAYKFLGITADTDLAGIKKAYRTLARKYHPDVNPNGQTLMQQLNAAYAVLQEHILNKASSTKSYWGSKETHSHDKASSGTRAKAEPQYNSYKSYRQDPDELCKKYMNQYFTFKPCKNEGEVFGIIQALLRSGRAKSREEIWITKDFRVFLIKDMSDQHLINAYKMLGGRLGDPRVMGTSTATNGALRLYEEIQRRRLKYEAQPYVVGDKVKIKIHF